MLDREPNSLRHTLGRIWPEEISGGALLRQPARPWDVLIRDRDDVLMVRTPYGERAHPVLLAAVALVASFALGWAGALNWPEVETMFGFGQVAQKEAPSPHIAEAKPARKTVAAPDLRAAAPLTVGSIPKPSARAAADPSNALIASPANASAAGAAMAMRPPPLAAAPETRPTTIPGWTVVEVRDGTAVLEGPDGIRMAARGDMIPGLGRIDSIVRWGNRWIVATANGLIATQ